MENIFEPAAAAGILQRLGKLQPGMPAQWGKMNVSQMLAHCQVPIAVGLGDKQLKQSFIGLFFGRIARKQLLKDTPFKKNLPTDANFIVKDERDFEKEKQLLQLMVQRFAGANQVAIAQRKHPIFGFMTSNEWGFLVWKHLDHHLKQFGV